jgi:hypothetical protein
MKEAAVGAQPVRAGSPPGLQQEEIAQFFTANAQKLRQVKSGPAVTLVAEECAVTLTDLALTLATATNLRLEDLERRLTVMEEKLRKRALHFAHGSGSGDCPVSQQDARAPDRTIAKTIYSQASDGKS